ncbi:porin [uncultured Succinivibrio sp.]|uniref:porin n=1 Tax=uncultured Succinivibrio sp. TaxID=540749 RepID=UPI0025CE0669|nr:porin [uncultured Succinivibrio sp.]
MKKSLLALAVVAVAASANAATIYEKDGTKLYVDGRVQSVYYSVNHKANKVVAQNDSNIKNSARFGIGGKTQITDWVAGYGYAQWDTSDGSNNAQFTARDQFVGADFGEFGKLQAGRYRDSGYYVENLTDHYEDAAGTLQGSYNGDRRGGQLTYIYENYGFHAQAGVQTAQDSGKVGGNAKQVDSGFNAALGYKTGDIVFGPLDFRVGYSYVKGQDGNDVTAATGASFDNFKHANFGLAWGNLNSGLYMAAIYDYAKFNGLGKTAVASTDNTTKNDGFELSVGYAFDNGVSALLGYEVSYWELNNANGQTKYQIRRVPLFVNYKLNSNFNIWTEFGFNAGSDHADKIANYTRSQDKNFFSLGARYTF